jgi:archaellum component FlaC
MIALIMTIMQKQRQGRSLVKSVHGWHQLVVRKVTLRNRMEKAVLRIRYLALQSIVSQWTRLTLKQRRRRGLLLLVVQRLQHRQASVVFDAWVALVSHDTAERQRAEQLQMLYADLQHCEMLMDQRVLMLATQKLKIRLVTRAINTWRSFASQRIRTQAKLQKSVRRLLNLTLSRNLLSWQRLARRAAHVRSIGDKVATRMQHASTAKSFHVIRAYAKQTKRIRKIVLQRLHCLVKQAFLAWADLAAYEVEERQCEEALQAAVTLRLHESEVASEVMQQSLEASVAEVEELEAQCSQVAKAASEATADVEKLQKEVDAFASTRDALAKKDARIRDLEVMVNALREEAVAALPARLNAILAAAQHLAEAKLQEAEAENLATKMTELTHLKDTLTGRIIEHQATAERRDDMVASASMPPLTGVFQSIDEEGSILALECELDATAKEIQLLETRMSQSARSLSEDNKSSAQRATSLLAGSATPTDGGDPEVATVCVGADDRGALGIEFKPVSIRALSPDGICQHRASHPLEAGMVLHTVNDIPAERLAYNA